MKLNQFFTKPVIAKPQATVFQLSNETREAELEDKIEKLEARIFDLLDKSEENVSLHRTNKELFKERKSLNGLLSSKTEEAEQQELMLDNLADVKMDLEAAQKQIKNLISQAEQQQATIESAQQNNAALNSRHGELEKTFTTVSKDYNHLNMEYTKLKEIASEQNIALDILSQKSEVVKNDYGDLIEEKKELQEVYQASLTHLDYWKATATNLANTLDEYEKTEGQLREWVKALTEQNGQEMSKSKGAKKRLQDTQKVISEMNGRIEDIEAEQEYLQGANIELKAKVAKPSYASFGAIERLENFAMASMGAATNRNKLYLGSAKPTLLKFKKREEKENDNWTS